MEQRPETAAGGSLAPVTFDDLSEMGIPSLNTPQQAEREGSSLPTASGSPKSLAVADDALFYRTSTKQCAKALSCRYRL